ncbi:MFS transporter [Mycolicibacterium frederiksbergense]|uniref:MFS transporter n=1 Tax=Mycolicibacterium frederiksbergense TaxID=117567 RepID=UPI00265C5CF2|nr:MFS transporter [Mycolicibacterium frederiksbergense]MBX9921151.1 MFS transporter [Mycolicibacterium frederiksbergense]MDO0975360.1 MFS transporter [Mycolicibacterium frederiksbergense]
MSTRRRSFAFAALAYAFAAVMIGTTLPTPLYALYAEQMHFSVVTTTMIFAVYALGVLAALLLFGRWSDAIGRRPVLLAGLGAAIASAMVFLIADSVALLLVGRLLSGLSAGLFTGTATAAVVEALPAAQRGRAAMVATIVNIGGLGIGPVLAGVLAQYAPHPLTLPFVVHIVLAAPAVVAVLIAPETSARTGRIGLQRLAIPAEVRSVFITAATAAFAGFAVTGLFAAIAPSFVADVVGIANHAVAGAMAGSVFLASAVAQLAGRRILPATAVAAGCVMLVVGMAILAVALTFSSLAGIIVAAVVAGTGQGISFSRGLAAVVEQVPAAQRGEISSTYFVVAYVAISVPVVGVGLAAQTWGLRTAGVSFAAAVAVLALGCLAAILIQSRRPARLSGSTQV